MSKSICASAWIVLLGCVGPLSAQVAWEARHGLTADAFQRVFDDLVGKGYRLTNVSGYEVDGVDYYAAIFEKRTGGAWIARFGVTKSQAQNVVDEFAKQNYSPYRVSSFSLRGERRFNLIMEKGRPEAWVMGGNTLAQHQQDLQEGRRKGLHLVQLNVFVLEGEVFFGGLWEKSPSRPQVVRHGLTAAQYQQTYDEMARTGYRLMVVSGYPAGNAELYAALWEKTGGPPFAARHGMTAQQYQNALDELSRKGYRPVHVSGYTVAGDVRYAAIFHKGN